MRLLLLCVCLALLAGCAGPAAPARPNVILITVDTTRADRMGFLGSTRGLTPSLDALAKEGAVFGRAYAQVPITSASHASILTGTYPQFHHVNDFGTPLAADLPYLPQILRERGYKTAAFVGSVPLDPQSGAAPGFARGFDTYDAGFRAPRPGEHRYQTVERRGGEVVARALSWLKGQRGPFFLWVHLFDPHAPYDPPEPFKTLHASDPYDGEIAYADSALGKLLDQLRASGLYDDTLIAVTADHGEAFGEHGERSHGVFLYDETIHVPLLFKMPARLVAGRRLDERAGLVDVAPTILDILGIPTPKPVQGESLLPLMKPADGRRPTTARTRGDRTSYAETDYPHLVFGWSSLRALRTDKYLLIAAPRTELYDLSVDPQAKRNLAASAGAVTTTLIAELDAFRRRTARSARAAKAEVKPELAESLAALGYVSSSGVPDRAGEELTGTDPKDKIEIANRVQEANLAGEEGRPQDAIRILEQVVAKDPTVPVVHRALAGALMAQQDFARAVSALRKAVELHPGSSTYRYELGLALFKAGDLPAAKSELEAAIAQSSPGNPHSAAIHHFTLAGVHNRMGRAAEAIKELRAAVQLDPESYDANLILGNLLSRSGNASAGLPYLQQAARLRPLSPDPHSFLADTYMQLGQQESATQERLEAQRLQAVGTP